MTLQKYLGKNPPRGAFSRIAEATGLSVTSVARAFHAPDTMTARMRDQISAAIRSKVPVFARIRRDKGVPRKSQNRETHAQN